MDEVKNFMKLAIQQAEIAIEHSEVPVGCVFVDRTTKEVLGSGFNQTNLTLNATRHAELVAIDAILSHGHSVEAFKNCDLYVTCEPCIMCAAALAKLQIAKVFFGCHNDRFGGNGSILHIHTNPYGNAHAYDVESGVLKDEAIEIFQRFYDRENERAPESKRRKKT
ncbi:nucleoside deaminase [archaeon]|nr:MAG: nucleoside deaminase [archaeon]